MGLLCKIVADFFFCVFKGSVVLELGLEVMAEGELLAVVAEETLDTGSVEFRGLVVFYVVDEIQSKLAAVYGEALEFRLWKKAVADLPEDPGFDCGGPGYHDSCLLYTSPSPRDS